MAGGTAEVLIKKMTKKKMSDAAGDGAGQAPNIPSAPTPPSITIPTPQWSHEKEDLDKAGKQD